MGNRTVKAYKSDGMSRYLKRFWKENTLTILVLAALCGIQVGANILMMWSFQGIIDRDMNRFLFWMLLLVADGLRAVVLLMEELAGQAGISEVLLEPVIKTVALSILTKLTVEICRSAGEGGVAAFVETAGAVLALLVALPLVRAVSQLMGELLI